MIRSSGYFVPSSKIENDSHCSRMVESIKSLDTHEEKRYSL